MIIISVILILFILFAVLGAAFAITGTLLKALIWLCVSLPVSLILFALGLAFCCTILLIPVGIYLIKAGARVLVMA